MSELLKQGTKVRVFRTCSYLDGTVFSVVGVAVKFPDFPFYILQSDAVLPKYGYNSIVLTSACFELCSY